MSITTDLDVIAEAVVDSLKTVGLWGQNVRQVESLRAIPAVDYPFPFALVADLGTEFELKNSNQDFLTHQFGIAVFVNAVDQTWAIVGGGGQTVGRRAMQKAIRDHFQTGTNRTLGGLVHLARISKHEPGDVIQMTSDGDTDPGAIVAVSVLDVMVFGG